MSHITVSAYKVAVAAKEVIEHIKGIRSKRDEDNISQAMSKKKYIFFGPTLTREEAIDSLTWRDHYPSCYAWGDLEQAENLLILAQNGDPITVSAEDARHLWGK